MSRQPDQLLAACAAAFALSAHAQTCIWEVREVQRPTTQAHAQAGWWVAGVGDLDRDGFADVAVGARFLNVGANTAAGGIFLYRGGRPAGSTFAAFIPGLSSSEHLGESIAGGADINGDGFVDFVAGAPIRASGTGGVDIFLGGSSLPTQRWATLAGEAADDWFGQAVAVGDLDGDRFAEIIVGAPYNDRAGNAAGTVFIFRGGSVPATTPWRVLLGEGNHHHFGWSVAYLGDFDSDGFGDIAVGARMFGSGLNAARGKVYLFRGGPAMSTTAAGAWLGEARDDWFGQSVAALGDIDGGGRPDLIVGAPYNDAGGLNAGTAYVFRGESPIGSPHAVRYLGESSNAQFGWAVGGAGDVNGNGRRDAIVGARHQAAGALAAAGRVYLFGGGSPLSASPIASANGRAANDWLGNAVGGSHGFVFPGLGTGLAGAPYDDGAGSDAGAAWILAPCAGCPADFNGDGQVDFFDYLDFVQAYNEEDPSADFNNDGQVDFFDYLDFVAAFAAGCE